MIEKKKKMFENESHLTMFNGWCVKRWYSWCRGR